MSAIDWLKEETEGSTPLDPDEAEGLIPTHITLLPQLDEWEHENILVAEEWALGRKRRKLLTEEFVRQLHWQMFNRTWKWAGTYRKTAKNIGVPPYLIIPGVVNALADATTWIEQSIFELDEVAVRVHHRLVAVHPFPNGNGRHARLFADTLLHKYNRRPLTWGRLSFRSASEARKVYLEAVKAGDGMNYAPLLALARA